MLKNKSLTYIATVCVLLHFLPAKHPRGYCVFVALSLATVCLFIDSRVLYVLHCTICQQSTQVVYCAWLRQISVSLVPRPTLAPAPIAYYGGREGHYEDGNGISPRSRSRSRLRSRSRSRSRARLCYRSRSRLRYRNYIYII